MNEKARLTGTIVHGKGLGHTVGMPTANLRCDEGSALPEAGVYASLLEVDGQTYFGVTNVGTRPSVDSDPTPTVETFLLHFTGDLYNCRVCLRLEAYLRPVRRMASLDEVRAQNGVELFPLTIENREEAPAAIAAWYARASREKRA